MGWTKGSEGREGSRAEGGPTRWLGRVVALVLIGQVGVHTLGIVATGFVRFPGSFGPVLTPDSPGYLQAAAELPALRAEYLTKTLYILLLRFDQALSLGGWGAVLLQLAMLALAGAAIASLVARHHGDRAAVLAAAVLVMNPQISQWVQVIHTDSLFISLVVVLAVVLARFLELATSPLPPLLLGTALAFLRPNGLGALVGVIVVVILGMRRFRAVTALVSIAVVATVLLLAPGFQTPGGEENSLAARTYEGLVIWMGESDVRITMPAPAQPDDLTNAGLVRYAATHPLAVLRLGLLRVGWELIQIRPHYPTAVNGIVALQMLMLTVLALIGLRRNVGASLGPAVLALSAGLLLVIAGTWAVAEGRFGWAVLAMWSPWIGIGADALLERLRPGRSGSVN
jgi:hypothetical protein